MAWISNKNIKYQLCQMDTESNERPINGSWKKVLQLASNPHRVIYKVEVPGMEYATSGYYQVIRYSYHLGNELIIIKLLITLQYDCEYGKHSIWR